MPGYNTTPPETQALIEAQRPEFEERIYREFFLSCVRKDPTLNEAVEDKATFFTRDPEDALDYARQEVSAMWFGWLLARGFKT